MKETEALERLAGARVGHLATAGADGHPHVVPFVFAVEGGRIVSAIDHKPKRSLNLRRLRNIGANPAVSVLVDHYEEDWTRLWWVRADGQGRVVAEGPEYRDVIVTLVAKYDHYLKKPPDGPVIVIDIERVTAGTQRSARSATRLVVAYRIPVPAGGRLATIPRGRRRIGRLW